MLNNVKKMSFKFKLQIQTIFYMQGLDEKMDEFLSSDRVFIIFGLVLYVPVISYGQVGTHCMQVRYFDYLISAWVIV